MKFSLDCYPCAVRQALGAIRRTGMEEERQATAMQRVMNGLAEVRPGAASPEIAAHIQGILREMTGDEDIYAKEKAESTAEALALYPEWKDAVVHSSDPLESAVRLSIAGNIIDFGPMDSYDLEATIQRVMEQPFALNELAALRATIEESDDILYLADNTGETVFDRILIETIGKPVTYAVKEAPILNDATCEDASAAGLDAVAEVISCGARYPGTLLAYCSVDFIKRFRQADLIISKGMGNYEALSSEEAPIFFLLQVKCDMVGQDLGVPKGSIVITKP
jgi:uncharacterized protein with ATP-grasp and redox domains